MNDAPGGQAANQPDTAQRLESYRDKLRQLKERSALREVMERDMLLGFITVNHGRINEYPLLEAQQNGIINILCYRSSSHPGTEHLKKYIASFLHLLNQYEKAVRNQDEQAAASLKTDIVNTETLLLKCLQGAVYAASLVHDNFEEIIIAYYGEQSISFMDKVTEKHELDVNYWRTLITHFVTSRIRQAYEGMVHEGKYELAKEANRLAIRFPFDEVLSELKPTDKAIDKTRVQTAFTDSAKGEQCRLKHRVALKLLHSKSDKILAKGAPKEEVDFISRIVCMDSIGEELAEKVQQATGRGDAPKEDIDQAQLEFTQEQAFMAAVGAAIAVDTIRDDFTAALGDFSPKAQEHIRTQVGTFELSNLDSTLFMMLETSFMNVLRTKAEPEGSKVRIRILRQRKTPAPEVEALFDHGLTKLRKNKLWGEPGPDGALLFKARTPKELQETAGVLQLENGLREKVYRLWQSAKPSVTFLVVVDMALLAKTTTNLMNRLTELLSHFDIDLNRDKNQSAPGDETS